MQKRFLGSTGLHVSTLGLGTVKFGRNQGVKYPESFELPSQAFLKEFLSLAKSLGINLIDTAPSYGESELRLGELLQNSRQDWIIVSKVGEEFENGVSHYDFSKQHIKKSIERSLQRLKTDYIDAVLVHSDGNDVKIIEQDDVFGTLTALKQQGLIRAFGASTKTVAGGLLTLEHSDIVMVTHNPSHQEEVSVIQQAYKKQKGVLIKKALISGHLSQIEALDPVQEAMRVVFKELGVNSVIIGCINAAHLKHNVACVQAVT